MTPGLRTLGGVTQVSVSPGGRSVTEVSDSAGRLLRRTDQGGVVTNYGYDQAGRLVSQTSSAGQSLAYAYDSAGQLQALSDNAALAGNPYSTSNIDALYRYDAGSNRVYEYYGGTTQNYDAYGTFLAAVLGSVAS